MFNNQLKSKVDFWGLATNPWLIKSEVHSTGQPYSNSNCVGIFLRTNLNNCFQNLYVCGK